MQQLKRLNIEVKEVLEDIPETRKSDIKLVLEVFRRRGINTSNSFASLALSGQLSQIESITRLRRKIQSEFPELKDDIITELRTERKKVFKEYMKNHDS